jgi:hypothetical protein
MSDASTLRNEDQVEDKDNQITGAKRKRDEEPVASESDNGDHKHEDEDDQDKCSSAACAKRRLVVFKLFSELCELTKRRVANSHPDEETKRKCITSFDELMAMVKTYIE